MRYVEIKNGVVTNAILCDDGFAEAGGYLRSDSANIGDVYENGVFSAQPADSPTDAEIAAAKVASKKAELKALREQYAADQDSLQKAWVAASFTDGDNESERIADIKAELLEVQAQYAVDVAAIKAKYL